MSETPDQVPTAEPDAAGAPAQPVPKDPTAAVEAVLAEMGERSEPLNLAVITDEELFAYSESPEEAAPVGLYFGQLSEEQQQAASLGALRALTARGLVESEVGPEGAGELELPVQTVAAIALRRLEPQVSLRAVGAVGETWYLLRYVQDGVFLRETVTSHGFHLLSLVRLDDEEREAFLRQLALPGSAESAAAPDVDLTMSQAQLEGAEIGATSQMDFLGSTTVLGNLVRVPEVEGVATSMIHVLESGGVVVGEIDAGRVRYRGATVADLRSDWQSWAAALAEAEPAVAPTGEDAVPGPGTQEPQAAE